MLINKAFNNRYRLNNKDDVFIKVLSTTLKTRRNVVT